MSLDPVDGILQQERDGLMDRVEYLERKTSEQSEDIACMKSALSDCLRRIQLLESTRGALPSSQTSRGAAAQRASSEARSRASLVSAASARSQFSSKRGPLSIGNTSPRRHLGQPLSGVEKKQALHQASQPASLSPQAKPTKGVGSSKASFREPSYLKDEGMLRMFLHGRSLNLYAPTDAAANYDFEEESKAPEEQLKLEWVYGYRGKDCRNNLYLLPTGEIVYFIAAVVVLYNIEEHFQRHYMEHTDDVKCLALHPDRITLASGQMCGHGKDALPHVRVWNSVSLETVHVLGLGTFENSVCCLGFSKSDGGSMLAIVDDSTSHTISLWEWQKARRLTETKASGEAVIAVEFAALDENCLVTIGKSHLAFWNFDGSTLSKRAGIFDKYDKPKFILCMAFAENGDLLTGDSNGTIFVWPRGTNRIGQAILPVHSGGIFSLCLTKDGHLISGGGKDYRLVEFDSSYNPTGAVVELTQWYGPVRTMICGPGDMLIIGTTRGCILQGNLGAEFSALVHGHSDEIWGLCTHPQTHNFLTGGNDGNIILWDSLTKGMVWAESMTEEIVCAAFYPATTVDQPAPVASGDTRLPDSVPVLAVGTKSGRWIVLDAVLHQVIAAHSESSESIQCIGFSPNGQYVAAGCRDNFIYVYNVFENGTKYTRLGRCSGHSSFVLHLDWSEDSQFLRSTSGDYELLLWNASSCKQVTAVSSLRDLRWATQNCPLGFEVAGIWPPGSDGTDINAVTRSHSTRLLSTADDFGHVNLFRFPVSQLKSESRVYGGHSSHVTDVEFLFDDSRLISIGGADTAIFQWEVYT